MTTIGYVTAGFREARRQRVEAKRRQRAAAPAATAAKTVAKQVGRRVGSTWMTLAAIGLLLVPAWQYATWAGFVATAVGLVAAENLLGIGD